MKKNIAVIFGGKSAEHDVSIITAHTPIIESLKLLPEYNIIPVYVSKNGTWYSKKEMLNFSFFQDKAYEKKLKKQDEVKILLGEKFFLEYSGIFPKKNKIDIAFPAMHGTFGEDGSLMGLLRLAGIPFVGCDIFASAIAMDKVLSKQIVSTVGVPVTNYIWFSKQDFIKNKKNILEKTETLKYPLFVKPVHLGSSIAISKVKNKEELISGIEVALFYDDKILVEEGVPNLIEVTLPIIGNEELEFANIEKPLNKSEFFDFQDKYIGSGGKKGGDGVNQNYSEIPANIPNHLQKKVLDYAERTYKTLGCSGISRVDFLINAETEEVFMNEVNPLPGSLYVHNFKKRGITGLDLVKKLISFAEEKFNQKKDLQHVFSSTVLESVNGNKIQ